VNAAQAPEAAGPAAHTLEVGQLDPERVSNGHVLDVAVATHKRTDLTPGLAGDAGKLACELLRNQSVSGNASLVELTEAADLAGFEPVGLTV